MQMNNLLDTKALEKHVMSVYSKAVPLMKKDGISMPLNTIFGINTSSDNQGEFCFTDQEGYHFRIIERGNVLIDSITQSLSEITYWAIKGEISEASAIYEAKNRISNQDFRHIMFDKRIQYFESISPEYAKMVNSEIETILQQAPFQDDLFK